MAEQLSKIYEPKVVEQQANEVWLSNSCFHAEACPDDKKYAKGPYTIVIPPPNVTAALHLGHALNNTLQDILVRFRRMQGFDALWMPGTDHAGIATQTVVEKRILSEEGKRRTDFARDEFVARVQAWKDEYEAMIIDQLKAMGCSCDWQRTRFTMDEVCAKAVRTAFFNLFEDGLIYRGKRLVNWDPATQTVLADDEVEHETIQGHFWYLRYPLEEPIEIPRSEGVPPLHSPGKGVSPLQNDGIIQRQGHNLPHWTKKGATYAVTFRLADSLPGNVLHAWRQEREAIVQRAEKQGRPLTAHEERELQRLYTTRIETFLDSGQGACHLAKPEIASLVQEALLHFDGQRYDLIAWCIMPNHVHLIVRPFEGYDLPSILHSWKSFTAKQANRLLGTAGVFWQEEYYDHLIRDEEDFYNQVNYVVSNPGRAGLEHWSWVGAKFDTQEQAFQTQGRDALATTQGQDALATMTITHVTVATTRPETMLGDTAVAMNPADPRTKYLLGRNVRLPIVGRLIPIIADELVVLPDPESEDEKARFSTGFLKVTPAHDPNDWEIGLRHNLEVINVMAPDGSISDKHGWADAKDSPEAQALLGMDRFEAREAIVEWFRIEGLLEEVREYAHEVGHSYRSHVPIEPYLSDQWYIAVKRPVERLAEKFGTGLIEGTDVPLNSLAGLALKPLLDGRLRFIPERYAATYRNWLENLRDWPISRQLWWGHQIPVWSKPGRHKNRCEHGSFSTVTETDQGQVTYACTRAGFNELEKAMQSEGWVRDGDVLDTWFSSALWPFSTMGWPEDTPEMKTFYPGDVLCTAREIITLWVTRMVMMGQYCAGDIPFKDVFIHAMIQDGEGRKMSKSLGNGIDPLVAIDSHGADAMRFTLASMTTETQDVRMPVAPMQLPDGRTVNTSPKFDIGRNFCNKLWNASRFAMMNLEGTDPDAFDANKLSIPDKWILSRLARAIEETTTAIEAFKYSDPLMALYRFFWNDFCDWYLEWTKPQMRDENQKPTAQNVLAFVLDRILRLLHPFVPFITEGIFQKLNEIAPVRGLKGIAQATPSKALVVAPWPENMASLIDSDVESVIESVQTVIRTIRDIRSTYNKSPGEKLTASASAPKNIANILNKNAELVCQLANLSAFEAAEGLEKPKNAAAAIVEQIQIYLHEAIDPQAERQRLEKQREQLGKAKASMEAKLANENFVSRAKPEVVEQTREKLGELTGQLEAVEKHLQELD